MFQLRCSSILRLTALAVLSIGLVPLTAIAQLHVEVGDAGDLPATAQIIEVVPILSTINGTLTAGDKDMFLIRTAGGAFSAEVATTGDSQLFLFNSSGLGVFANDDFDFNLAGPSKIEGILAPGDYYLAISQFNNNPVSAGGLIFPDDFFGVVGPTGPGGASSITGWSGSNGSGFEYTIALTNASGVPRDGPGVPDGGSTLVLFGIAIAALGAARRRL